MNNLLARFLLSGGETFLVVMTEDNARTLVREFRRGRLTGRFGDDDCPLPWAVDASCIQAIHIVQPNPEQGQMAPRPAPLPGIPPLPPGVRFSG